MNCDGLSRKDVAMRVACMLASSVDSVLGSSVIGDTHVKKVFGVDEVFTDIDVKLNSLIKERLFELTGADCIVGEEDGASNLEDIESFWLVDPIDGTRSFIDGVFGCSAMVSLVESGVPVLSVVYDFNKKELFSIIRNLGVFAVEKNALIPVRRPDDVSKGVIWNRYSNNVLRDMIMDKMKNTDFYEVESTGLRALSLYLGKGSIFVSLPGSAKIWDTAPAAIIMGLVSGMYTDIHGETLSHSLQSLSQERGAVASVGVDHDTVLSAVNDYISMQSDN